MTLFPLIMFSLALPGATALTPFPTLSLGADYYPEMWPSSQWESDAAAMQAAGMTTVRLAEFAWHTFQPCQACPFNFSYLDSALTVLSSHGIRAILGTPTASPPQWLYELDPTIALVDVNQQRVGTGSRQNMNHLNPVFLAASDAIVEAMAAHYAGDARVAAWQIDNELHGERDYSALTQAGFAGWLALKYNASTDAMNSAWGTQFWGEEYNSFASVPLPWATADLHNPGLALDYRRYIAHIAGSYLERQAAALRRLSPGIPITHNCMGMYSSVDYARFGRSLDFAAFDNYPLTWFSQTPTPPDYSSGAESFIYAAAMQHAAARAVKPHNSYMVMEQQVSNTGQNYYYGSGWQAGYRLAAWQAIANGADGIQFFRWRSARWGQEQHWEGVLNWDGSLQAPRYAAVAALGAEFQRVSQHVRQGLIQARVAVLWSLETAWTFEEQPLTAPAFDAQAQMRGFLAAFRALGAAVDLVIVPADTGSGSGSGSSAATVDLSPYSIVLAPSLVIVPDALAASLAAFVAAGGSLFLSMRSGSKDATGAYVGTTLPGPFAALAGMAVHTWDPLCSLGEAALVTSFTRPPPPPFGAAQPLPLSTSQGRICEVLTPTHPDTRVLARYSSGVHAGAPAVTLLQGSAPGSGAVLYSGSVCDVAAYYEAVAVELAAGVGSSRGSVQLLAQRLPEGVESSVRQLPGGGGRAVFVLNWGGSNASVSLPEAARGGGCRDVLGSTAVSSSGDMVLPPYEVAIFACPTP